MNTNGVEMLSAAISAGAASLIVFIYALKLILDLLKVPTPVLAPRAEKAGRKIEPLSTRV
jgi:hypothetical protein